MIKETTRTLDDNSPCPTPGCGKPRYRAAPNKSNRWGQLVCNSCSAKRSREVSEEKKVERNNRLKITYQNKHYLRKLWDKINSRCHYASDPNYEKYGRKGVSVVEAWRKSQGHDKQAVNRNKLSFESFYNYVQENLGDKPDSSYSLDRINNTKGYEPGNIQWATKKQQVDNRSCCKATICSVPETSLIYYHGIPQTIREFSEKTGIIFIVVQYRYGRYPGNTEWILRDDYDNRHYFYRNQAYNKKELCLISSRSWDQVSKRLRLGWNVEDVLNRPTLTQYTTNKRKEQYA